jgi:hypothetical protein
MAAPDSAALAAFLGRSVDSTQATAVIQVVTALAKSYTRGQGFTANGPAEDIAAVILTASARLISNARGLLIDETEGPSSVSYRSAFQGFSAGEQSTLNRYRVRAL